MGNAKTPRKGFVPKDLPKHEPAKAILLLDQIQAAWEPPVIEVQPSLRIRRIDREFKAELKGDNVRDINEVIGDCSLAITFEGTAATLDLLTPHAFAVALILVSDAHINPRKDLLIDHSELLESPIVTITPRRDVSVHWGHYRETLTEVDLQAANAIFPEVLRTQAPERFRRVVNAIRFYENGYSSENPDLALVAFVTCLEGLFSTMQQEISFRLALRLATFMEDKKADQEMRYEEARQVYDARSKIVHGAPIDKNEEQAAIVLVEYLVPLAERLARMALHRIFAIGLVDVFDSHDRVNKLFDRLLFRNSLQEAIAALYELREPNSSSG